MWTNWWAEACFKAHEGNLSQVVVWLWDANFPNVFSCCSHWWPIFQTVSKVRKVDWSPVNGMSNSFYAIWYAISVSQSSCLDTQLHSASCSCSYVYMCKSNKRHWCMQLCNAQKMESYSYFRYW